MTVAEPAVTCTPRAAQTLQGRPFDTGLWRDDVQEELYGEPLLDDVDRPSTIDDDEDEDHFLARQIGKDYLEESHEPELETEWDGE